MLIQLKNCNCTTSIIGRLAEEYSPASDPNDYKDYPYEDTISANILVSRTSNTDESVVDEDYLIDNSIVYHAINGKYKFDLLDVTIKKDGWYGIYHIEVPTTTVVDQFIDLAIENKDKSIYKLHYLIAFDINQSLFVLRNLQATITGDTDVPGLVSTSWDTYSCWEIITPEQLLLAAKNVLASDYLASIYNIKVEYKDTFSICLLYTCYVNKAQSLLNKYKNSEGFCSSDETCTNNLKKYTQDILIRDYLWMAINVIKYLLECEDYEQALKVLSCVQSCSGVCGTTTTTNGCGCSK